LDKQITGDSKMAKKTPVYHVGLGKRGKTLIIEAVKYIDFLSCETYDYMGERETTKKSLKNNRYKILELAKKNNPKVYGKLKFAVVE
jgi:hypothetical protein